MLMVARSSWPVAAAGHVKAGFYPVPAKKPADAPKPAPIPAPLPAPQPASVSQPAAAAAPALDFEEGTASVA
jgi:hypothetical protein